MPRRIDVLTLGLSAPSRWNPLYRWWARRTTVNGMAVALKALQLRLDADELVLSRRELEVANTTGALIEPLPGGGVRLRLTGERPSGIRILWGQRSTDV